MKRTNWRAAGVAALLAMSPSVSAAQDGAVWQSPAGDFAATVPAGWGQVPVAQNDDRTVVDDTRMILSIASPEIIAGGAGSAECSVAKVNEVPSGGAAQQAVNDSGATLTQDRVVGSRPITVSQFTNEIRDGVRMIGYEGMVGTQSLAQFESYSEHFVVVQGDTVRMYAASCALLAPASLADQAAVRRFLDSFDFHN